MAPLLLGGLVVSSPLLAAPKLNQVTLEDGPAQPESAEPTITFAFKGATFEQVVDFFGRAAGLPVVWEAAPPAGTLRYQSDRTYGIDDGLQVLNTILQAKGVMLRRREDMLYLQPLAEMAKRDVPTFVGSLPDNVRDDEVVTLVLPLRIASASALVEQLRGLVAGYGSVSALPQQNALVVVETAAQVRRLAGMVASFDAQDTDGIVRIIKLEHVRADAIMGPLRSLLAVRIEKYVVDAKGKQVKVEDEQIPGISFSPDARTNSLIVKGNEAQISKLEEAVRLLDVPTDRSSGRRTFTLENSTPQEVMRALGPYINQLPRDRRPKLLPIAATNRLFVAGNDAVLEELAGLVVEYDGGDVQLPRDDGAPAIEVVALDAVRASDILPQIRGVLSVRQQQVLRMVAGPEDRTLILAGPASDVAAVKEVLPVFDKLRAGERDIVILPMRGPDAQANVERALTLARDRLASRALSAGDQTIEAVFDAQQGTVRIEATPVGADTFRTALDELDQIPLVAPTVRQVSVQFGSAAKVADDLTSLLQMLSDVNGRRAAEVSAVEAFNALLLTGSPDSVAEAEALLGRVDLPKAGAQVVRTVSVQNVADPEQLLEDAQELFEILSTGSNPPDASITAMYKEEAEVVLFSGSLQAVQRMEEAMAQARAALPAPDVRRVVAVQRGDAEQVAERLRTALDEYPKEPGQSMDPVDVSVLSITNELVLIGPEQWVQTGISLLAKVDRLGDGPLPPLRLLGVRNTDAATVADLLRRRFDARGADERRSDPVEIDVAEGANVLIITASDDRQTEIKGLVDELNAFGGADREGRVIRIFPLKTAQAEELARTLDEMFPEKPVPLDRRGRPMTELREPRDVVVRANRQTNSLIVDALADRMSSFEELVRQLDREQVRTETSIRTYRLTEADPQRVAASLRELSAQGVLNVAGGDRRVPVNVSVEEATKSLIISGPDEAFARIEALIENLDVAPPRAETELRFFQLEHAQAERMAQMFRPILLGRMQELMPDLQDQPSAVEVTAEPETNTLIVSAPVALQDVAQELVDRLDRSSYAGRRTFRTQRLDPSVADAEEIARNLRRLLEREGGPRVRVMTLEELLSEQSASEQKSEPKIPGQGGISANPISGLVAAAALGALPESDAADVDNEEADLIVAVDPATNSLVYLGSPESIESATALVNELAAELPPPPAEILSIELPQSVDPNALTKLLQNALLQLDVAGGTRRAQKIGLLPNPESNALVVTASPSDLELVTQLLAAIAKPVGDAPREARVFRLENADTEMVADAIYSLVGREEYRRYRRDPASKSVTLSYPGFDPIVIQNDQVDVTGDWSTGSVMVTAPANALPILAAFVADLDLQEDGVATLVETFRLEFAQAEGMRRTILPIVNSQFSNVNRYGDREELPLEIRADVRTNTLVVAGTESQLEAVSGLVDILDVSDEAEGLRQRKIELVQVLEADPNTVARALREQFPRGRGDELTVTVDPRTRSIALGGTEAVLGQARELVALLDQPEAAEQTVLRTFRLDEGRADEAVRLLTSSLGLDAQGRTTGTAVLPEGADEAVLVRARIVADQRTNAVVVNATAESMPIIEGLLEELASAPPKPMREFHVVQLEYAMADDVVYTLQRVSDRGTRDVPGPSFDFERDTNRVIVRATTDQWQNIQDVIGSLDRPVENPLVTEIVSLQWSEAKQVREALGIFYGTYAYAATTPAQRSVSIVADPSTGSLVISAPEGEWESIRSLISKLDREENDASLQLRSFTLDHADSRAVARAINEAFAGELAGRNQRAGQAVRGREDRDAPPAVLVEANEWVRASAETETNSVVVAANRNRMDKIAEIINSLDLAGQEAQGGVVEVIRIASSSSSVIADELRRTFNPVAKRRNQPLSIQASVASNAIIVSAPPPLMERIEQTVAALESSAPSDGEAVLIIDLDHVSPQDAQRFLNSVGAAGGQDAAGRNFREPLRISPVPGRNAIVVAMNPADRDRVTSLLKALDRENTDAAAEVRLVQLQRNRADAIVNIVRRVLEPSDSAVGTPLSKGLAAQLRALRVHQDGGADEDLALDLTVPIKVQPDTSSNTVVVTSSRANVQAIESFIELLDRVPVTPSVSVNVMVLDHIDAGAFSALVRDLASQSSQLSRTPVSGVVGLPADPAGRALLTGIALSVDDRTNAIVVAGSEEAVALVEVMRIKMDVPASDGWLEPRLFPVQHANVEDLARRLNDLLSNSGEEPDAARRFGRLRVVPPLGDSAVYNSRLSAPLDEVYVSAESRLGAILVVAETEHLQIAAELIGMLDVPSFRTSGGFASIGLANASAELVAGRLQRVIDEQREIGALGDDDGLLVEPDVASNAIILSGSPPALELARSVLPTLDTASSDVVVETIALVFADPVRVADVAQSLLQARSQMRQRMGAGARAVAETAVVLPDLRSNSVLVTATQTGLEIVQDLVLQLDVERDLNETVFEVIPVGRAGLSRTADAVGRLLERRTVGLSTSERARRQALVIPDARTGALLVAAAPEDIEVVQAITDQLLEIPDDPALGLHVVAVPANLEVDDVARRIEQLMQERERSLGDAAGPDDRVVVEAERSSNALLVAASQANLEEVEYLVELLSSTGDQLLRNREVALISVEGDTAENMVELLEDLYVDDANRRRPNSVRVVADSRSNGILVSGSPGDVRAIRDLIQRIDTQDPARLVEVRTVALASANAIETVSLIESVLRGGGRSRRGAATVLRYLGEDGDPVEVSLALRDVIALTPDVRTNSVIVSAPPDSLSLLVRMISDLDTSSTGAKSVRVFELVNADAAAMREILVDLFNLRQSGNLYVLKPREGGAPADAGGAAGAGGGASDVGGGEGFLGDDLTAVPDERQQLSITVDRRTNALLVSGTPKYLDLVKNVVEQLDSLEANERETFTVQLRNAKATDVASIVTDFVEEEQRKLVGTLSDEQLGSATRLLEREITIKGDEKTNTVLVSASPRHSERVRQLLEQLDVDPPQVLIGVMLAEVTLDRSSADGLEANVTAGGGTARGTLGFGLGTAALTGVAAPSMEVSGTDFGLFLRALRAQGRLQVLSNPAVMAANNEQARLQVGDLIRVADAQSVSDNGVNTTTREEQLGITLEVTPTITPDGFVRMDVKPSIRDLSARSVQISEDLISPVITTREAETTVTVKDGQTIVLGGLISDRYEKRTEKVPLLGDLPGLGYLFRGERETDARTELLIVLTPHVIDSPQRSSRVSEITNTEASRLSLPPEVLDMIRDGRINPTSGLFDANGERLDFSEEE
ncbi:MAG: secretin N-terminal domain-containing protein [Planctomycetota bacterium]